MQAECGGQAGGPDQKDKPALADVAQPDALGQFDRQGLAQPPVERIQGLGAFGQRPKPVVSDAHGRAR